MTDGQEMERVNSYNPGARTGPVQYSPRRQSRWVLADYGGKDLWKRRILSMEWSGEWRMEGESGEQVGDEWESVYFLSLR